MKLTTEPYTVKAITKNNIGDMLNHLRDVWQKQSKSSIEKYNQYTPMHDITDSKLNDMISQFGGIGEVPFYVTVKVNIGGACVDMPFSTLIIYKDKLKQIKNNEKIRNTKKQH